LLLGIVGSLSEAVASSLSLSTKPGQVQPRNGVVAFRDTAPVAGSCPQPAGSWLDGYTGTTELVSVSGFLRLPKAVMCSLQEGGRVAALWVQDKLCAAMPWAPVATVLTVERDGREALVSWPVLWVRR